MGDLIRGTWEEKGEPRARSLSSPLIQQQSRPPDLYNSTYSLKLFLRVSDYWTNTGSSSAKPLV